MSEIKEDPMHLCRASANGEENHDIRPARTGDPCEPKLRSPGLSSDEDNDTRDEEDKEKTGEVSGNHKQT